MSATRPPAFDDRLSTPIEASRRGAHRARPKPASAGLPVAAGVAVVLLVLGGGYVMLRTPDPGSDANPAAAIGDDPKPTSTAANAVKSTAPTPAATAGGEAAEPSSEPAATGAKAGGGKVNRDIRFKLLNSTSVQGLAKRIKTDLVANGWSIDNADMGNSRNRGLAVTKIYFGKPGTKATAQALKKDLGFGTVVRDASALTASDLTKADLAVVLGDDAT
jgi:hypothetical protein